ncbi:MAG: hypothetical protein FJ217_01280 [Ignavibacteria bacterium]|nr:hypothetical protein [Ignavibacteria bacterium]
MNKVSGILVRLITILIFVACLMPYAAQAQFAEDALRFSTFNVPVGARSAGMGNTSVGIAADYSALFTNPGGLALVRSFEFSVGLTNSNFGNDLTFYGITTKSDNSVTNLNNIGLVYPVPTKRGSLSFAFGFARVANYSSTASFNGFNPYSSLVEALTPDVNVASMSESERESFLENNLPFQIFLADTFSGRLYPNVIDSIQQEGTVREGGGINNWSLGGAIDIAKNISVGVAFNLLSGSYSYDRVYTERDARNVYHYAPPFDFDRFRYQSTVNSDLSGFNLLFGLMYRKPGRYNVGFTVKTPTYYEIEEGFSDVGTAWFDNGDWYEMKKPGSTKYNIRTPVVLSGGLSLQLTEWLALAGDAEYTDWTQMEFTNDNPDLADENWVIRDVMQATTNLRGGAEVSLWDYDLKLRGGVVYNPSPYKGDPKDFDQLYYTAGIGIAVENNVSLNASYAFGKWKTFRDNYYIPGLSAPSRTNESVNRKTLNVTLSYRF